MKRPKLAPLKPTLRERKRYLVFKISGSKTTFNVAKDTLYSEFRKYLGDFGVAKAGLWIFPDLYNSTTQMGVLRCTHSEVDTIRAAFVAMNTQGFGIHTVGVSGILKKAQSKFMKK